MTSRSTGQSPDSELDRLVYARVRAIPEGRVTTYGDLLPGRPRRAGTALRTCDEPDVPWHRVVRADGSLAKGERQRALLEAEDVPFRRARVDMEEAWVPADAVAPDPARLTR